MHTAVLLPLLFCFLLNVQAGFTDSTFEQLASMTCDGDVFLLPDHPELGMRFNVSNVVKLYEMFSSRMYERAQCACPGLSKDEFNRNRAYYTPEFWANMLTKKDNHTTCREWMLPARSSYEGPYLNIVRNLLSPYQLNLDWSTCNWDLYTSGQGCTMSFYVTSLNIKLQVAIKKCTSNDYFPYVSLTCNGKMCSRFMMPCNSQNDCGEGRCHGLAYRSSDSPMIDLADLLETLKIAYVLDGEDGDDPTQAVTFYENLLGLGRKVLYGFATPLKLQAPNGFVNFPVCSPPLHIMADDWTSACSVIYIDRNSYSVTCDAFSTWDGKLMDGSDVFAPERMSGSKWTKGYLVEEPVVPVSEGTVLADLTCSGQLSALPQNNNYITLFQGLAPFFKLYAMSRYNPAFISLLALQPFTVKLPVNIVYKYLADYLKDFEQQRAISRGGILSDMAFSLTWAWEQFLYDWVQAPQGQSKPNVDHGPQMSSLRTFLQDVINSQYFYQVSLSPNSCSYDRWSKTGECSGDYTGFSKLFEVDATIRMSAKTCGPETIPAMQALCVGAACSGVFGSPIACSSQLDCHGGLICAPLTDRTFLNSNFDALFLASVLEGNPDEFPFDVRTSKCAGYSQYQKDINHFLSGLNIQGQGVGICQVNWTKVVYPDPSARYNWDVLHPTSHLLDWVNQAMAPIHDRLIDLSWFADWLNN